ncbi:MAG: MATE family efflux transporter, partial [Oscillospiraceae bacterium]|nr:MATE family efflux transporter [Oscillospiraceae bacterium]
AVGVGFLSFIAQACGANDRAAAQKAVSQAVLITLVGGIFVTILTTSLSGMVPKLMQVDPSIQQLCSTYFFIIYLPMLPRTASTIFGTVLRAAGDTKTPMKVGILVNVINVIGNFLLIYPTRSISLGAFSFTMPGAGWGVIGAAIASAVAFTWGGIHITYVLWKHPMVSPKGSSLRPDLSILKPCIKIAFPNMLQRFGTSMGFVAFASMINSIGEVATAAHTIANTVESAFYIPGYGMQTAASTLAGNAYGARDNQRMKKLAAMFIPVEIGLMILSGAALFTAAPTLMTLFSTSEEVINLGATVLRMVAVSEPFYGFSIIVEGLMLGVGKTKEPFVFNVLGMWCIRIVGTFICTQLLSMGLVSAWACMIGHNLLVCALYMITYIRGTWNPMNQELAAAK